MSAETTRALVFAFAEALEHRDWDAFTAVLSPEMVYELPQTRERIRGRDRYVQFNAEYPGDWHVEPQLVIGDDHDGCLLFRWTLDDASVLAVAFFEIHGDRIVKVTDLWPEPYDPPAGREQLVERF
ncbi:MAG: nuclear transport factor 2 family protein [Candidatus Dormibacteraeota bacterium]|nr:nuclear transport factor 2 family protein [Candidatus Dormibacteraeota bacterium]